MSHRTVAALAAVGGAAHLSMLLPHLALSAHAWLFGTMSLACLACAVHLWVRAEGLALTALMAGTMIVLHLGYAFTVAQPFGATASHHGVAAVDVHSHGDSPAVLVPLLPELAVLALAGPLLRRQRVLAAAQ
ncbi:hypothetical protein [Kineosporia babensis]|uniref:Uncharacterized protein n=1 Tax=Kineosporia babensis TaxID=499548 RepID=A0A9X1SU18_9ACTN|nr:hypothetical protein [Kineosporia babensis]MCD5311936.1 hypothetical protein [Kineosporia babensis]